MFKVLQWNCRNLRNKDPYLSLIVNIHRPSVICLQETRLDDQPDPTVLTHYHPYKRYDGQGVAIYTHKTLTQTEETLNTPLEAGACRVKFNDVYSVTGPGHGGVGRVSSRYIVCKVLLCVS